MPLVYVYHIQILTIGLDHPNQCVQPNIPHDQNMYFTKTKNFFHQLFSISLLLYVLILYVGGHTV